MNQTITSCYCNKCGRSVEPIIYQILEGLIFANHKKNMKHNMGDLKSPYNTTFLNPNDIHYYHKMAIRHGILEVQQIPSGLYYYNIVLPFNQEIGQVEIYGQKTCSPYAQDLVKFVGLYNIYNGHAYASSSFGTVNSYCNQCGISLNCSFPTP